MVLHGVYDHGKIYLTDDDLPDIKADIEIKLIDKISHKSIDQQETRSMMRLSESAFEEWDNEEDSVYDNL